MISLILAAIPIRCVWENETSCLINDTQLQNQSLIEYDTNYDACYAVTGLPSDLWNSGNNNTYWNYQYVGCDYCSYNVTNVTGSWQDQTGAATTSGRGTTILFLTGGQTL